MLARFASLIMLIASLISAPARRNGRTARPLLMGKQALTTAPLASPQVRSRLPLLMGPLRRRRRRDDGWTTDGGSEGKEEVIIMACVRVSYS